MGFFSYRLSKNIIQDEVGAFSILATRQAADKMHVVYESIENTSKRFLTDKNFIETFDIYREANQEYDKFEATKTIQEMLKSIEAADDRISSISLYYVDGQKFTATNSSITNNIDPMWLKAAVEAGGKSFWIPTRQQGLTPTSGKPSFGLAKLIKDITTNKTMFVALIEVKYEALNSQLSTLDLGDQGKKYILDDANTIVYAEDQTLLGQVLELPKEQEKLLENRSTIIDAQLLSLASGTSLNTWRVVTTVPV
jgi:hypothetical protein